MKQLDTRYKAGVHLLAMENTELTKLVPSEMSPPLAPMLVTDFDGLKQVVEYMNSSDEFVIDLETNVVDDFTQRRIRTIQIGGRNRQFVIDLLAFAGSEVMLANEQGDYCPVGALGAVTDALRPALESRDKLKIGVYIQFEHQTLLYCLGIRLRNMYCCTLADKVIFCGAIRYDRKGVYTLAAMAARYLRVEVDKSHQTSFDLATPLTQAQVDYAALDVRLPVAIRNGQLKQIASGGLAWAVKVENEAIPAFGEMHLNGFYLNLEKWEALIEENSKEYSSTLAELDAVMLPIVGGKGTVPDDLLVLEKEWRDEKDKVIRAERRKTYFAARKRVNALEKDFEKYEGNAAINYNSAPQLRSALVKSGIASSRLPDTNDRTLEKLTKHKAVRALMKYRKIAKIVNTYGRNWYEYINPTTGRIHSNILQLGAETGRTSSTRPNIQNIPKDPRFRACFTKQKPETCIITIDYNGCELRLLSEYTKQQSWIDAFNNNWDVHSYVAEMLYGDKWKVAAVDGCAYYNSDHKKCKCPEHEKLRGYVKSINFGIAYGMSARKLSEELGISNGAAEELLAEYNRANSGVMSWLEEASENAQKNLESRTFIGRRRKFARPDWDKAVDRAKEKYGTHHPGDHQISSCYKGMFAAIGREGRNSPVQGANADLIKIAIGDGLDKEGKPFLGSGLKQYAAKLVNLVHDEIVIEAPLESAEAVLEFATECMVRAGREFVSSVVMEAEGHIDSMWRK